MQSKLPGRVLFVGFGSVAQCALPILFQKTKILPSQVTVLDFEDRSEILKEWTAQGVKFVRDRVTPDNMGALLAQHVSEGDVLIDLAWNIDACEILQWCHDKGVMYLNTSVEVWDPYAGMEPSHPTQRTLYWRHMNVRAHEISLVGARTYGCVGTRSKPRAGVSLDQARTASDSGSRFGRKQIPGRSRRQNQAGRQRQSFQQPGTRAGVKVIHCSERDTQVTQTPKRVGEFVNTWSVEGFREEGIATAEMGWGTHEKHLPALAYRHENGPQNQICLAKMGMNTWVRSWVPDWEIHGMVVRHGEAFTISDSLTVWKNGEAVYRPTVHYAYCPSDSAIASLNELRGNNYQLQPNVRILNDEITEGADTLGALIMGHPYQSWWVGSRLSIEESRRLVPHQNATTMQVAISVVAAVMWMVENPNRGICVPDDLPHDFILEVSNPYLGEFISTASDWTPLKNLKNFFEGYAPQDLDKSHPWQFKNFLVQE